MQTVHASPAPVQPGPAAAWPAWTDAVAYWPADVDPTGPTPADAAWAAQEFGTLADRRELQDYYDSISGREFDEAAEDALARDLYQAGILPC